MRRRILVGLLIAALILMMASLFLTVDPAGRFG